MSAWMPQPVRWNELEALSSRVEVGAGEPVSGEGNRRWEGRCTGYIWSNDCVGVAKMRYCFEVLLGDQIQACDGCWASGDNCCECFDNATGLDVWPTSSFICTYDQFAASYR